MAVVAPNPSRDGHEAGTSDVRRPGSFSLALGRRSSSRRSAQARRRSPGQSVPQLEQQARQEQGYALAIPLEWMAQAAVNRVALQRALVAHGWLRLRSHRELESV